MKRLVVLFVFLLVAFGMTSCLYEYAHQPGDAIIVKEATCNAEGISQIRCTECGEIVKTVEIPKTNKHVESVIPAVESSCTEKGLTEGKMCSVCGVILVAQQEVALQAHVEEILSGVAVGCEVDGKTEGKACSVCGTILVEQSVIPAPGHSFGEWVVVNDPTVSEEGLQERICKCGKKETQSIE